MGEMLLAMPPKGISLLPLSNFPPLQDLQPHASISGFSTPVLHHLAIVSLQLRRCCVELHYGIVLGDEFWPGWVSCATSQQPIKQASSRDIPTIQFDKPYQVLLAIHREWFLQLSRYTAAEE